MYESILTSRGFKLNTKYMIEFSKKKKEGKTTFGALVLPHPPIFHLVFVLYHRHINTILDFCV